MNFEIVLSIIGTFIAVALVINGFFLRSIFLDLNAVRVELAGISARNESKELRLNKIEDNEKDIFSRINKLEIRECHNELCNT